MGIKSKYYSAYNCLRISYPKLGRGGKYCAHNDFI